MVERVEGIVTGLDGTLVRHDRQFPSPPILFAAQQLRIPLIPATEQSVQRVKVLSGLLNLRSMGVADAGATIWDCGQSRVKHSRWLRPAEVLDITTSIGEYEASFTYHTVHGLTRAQPRAEELSGVTSLAADFPNSATPQVVEALGKLPDIQFKRTVGRETSSVSILRAGVTLQEGVESSFAYQGFNEQSRLMAIGGASEDIALFEAVGTHSLKIALGNAPDELKATADVVVSGVETDGFIEALRVAHLMPDAA